MEYKQVYHKTLPPIDEIIGQPCSIYIVIYGSNLKVGHHAIFHMEWGWDDQALNDKCNSFIERLLINPTEVHFKNAVLKGNTFN